MKSTAISQIANVTQNNTATSEESAAAAEELASQAEVFYASVADFKLKNDSNSNSYDAVVKQKDTEKPRSQSKSVNKTNDVQKTDNTKQKNVHNIDLSSDDMIILDDTSDIIINESLDFGKY